MKEVGWRSQEDWRWYLMTANALARRGRRRPLNPVVTRHKKAVSNFNSRARKHKQPPLTLKQYESVITGKCLRCGVQETPDCILGVDHVVPIWYGGSSETYNLQALCWPCNKGKGVSVIDYRCSPPRQYLIDDKTMQVVVKEL
jgi:5-methylcytosine-specific restriction endonuclease McrA